MPDANFFKKSGAKLEIQLLTFLSLKREKSFESENDLGN
jgi:hypothetical protein